MKENTKNQVEGVYLPPAWCGAICRNAMNEICVEHCAIKRDCSGFDEKPNLILAEMPRFPKTEGMSKEEKFTSVTIYLAKVVNHLQGVEDEQQNFVIRRPNSDNTRSSTLPKNFEVKDLLSGIKETDTSHKAG